jgi:hypothetical protein
MFVWLNRFIVRFFLYRKIQQHVCAYQCYFVSAKAGEKHQTKTEQNPEFREKMCEKSITSLSGESSG